MDRNWLKGVPKSVPQYSVDSNGRNAVEFPSLELMSAVSKSGKKLMGKKSPETRRHACDIAEIHLMDRDWLRSVPKSVRQESLAPEGAGENQSGGKP